MKMHSLSFRLLTGDYHMADWGSGSVWVFTVHFREQHNEAIVVGFLGISEVPYLCSWHGNRSRETFFLFICLLRFWETLNQPQQTVFPRICSCCLKIKVPTQNGRETKHAEITAFICKDQKRIRLDVKVKCSPTASSP